MMIQTSYDYKAKNDDKYQKKPLTNVKGQEGSKPRPVKDTFYFLIISGKFELCQRFSSSISNYLIAMHEALFQYMETRSGQKLSDEERQLIKSKFTTKRLRK